MKVKTKRFLSILLSLAMMLGMLSGMSLTAYAEGSSTSTLTFSAKCDGSGTADDNVTWTVESDADESNFDKSKGIHYGTTSKPVQYIRLSTSGITGTITKVVVNASYGGSTSGVNTVGVNVGGTAFGGNPKTIVKDAADYTFTGSGSGEIKVTVTKPEAATGALYVKSIAVTYSTSPIVDVTNVTLNKTSATLAVGGTETLTATVAPTDATDKKVKWSTSGSGVKLYTNEACTTEVGTDATETLTVYAKGESAGSATITATSNADSTKSASCDVTVNVATAQYYVVGSMNGWSVEGSYLMTYDEANAEFQLLGVSFSADDQFKVVKSEDSSLTWYPEGMGNDYTITADGNYNIHFRPDGQGGDGWYEGCIKVEAAAPEATYTVTWKSQDGTETYETDTDVAKDTKPSYDGSAHTKAEDDNYTYTFAGWATSANQESGTAASDLPAVTDNITYYAAFSKTQKQSYSVTVTAGSNMTKTETSGEASQTGLTGAMTDVVYTANDGYYFPEDYSVAEVNGISVTRDSYTQITVSGTPTADATIALTAPTEKSKETTPTTATFMVTGAYEGTLSGVANGMKYSLDGGTTWTDVTSNADIELTGLSGCTIQVVKKGGNTTADSDPQEITVAQASKPEAEATHCTSKDNNDGKLIGVTTAMEYKKSDAENWTDGTGSDITGLLPGTYFVRVKVTDTALASENQALTIEPYERTNPFEGRVYNIGDELYLSDYCYVNYQDGSNSFIYWTAKTDDVSYYYGKTYQIPTPTWNESRKNWTFPEVTSVYYNGTWYDCAMWLGWTDDANGGEIVTGVKCIGGDGSWESPYTFALVFESRPEASATGYSGEYDGAAHGITVTVTDPASGATVKYGTAEGTYDLDASPEYTDAGEYTVYYEVKAEGRSTLRGSADINIAKADVTVTAQNQNIHVNGTVPDLSSPVLDTHYTVTGLVGEDTLTTAPTLAYQKDGNAATPDNTTAGTYDIVVSGASAGDNYNISYTNGTLTINKANAVAATVTANNRTYDGTTKPLVTVTGEVIGGEMQYALGTATKATEPYTTSIPTATKAGTYYVWYMVKGDNTHNDTKAASVKVSIAKRRVTLTSGTAARVYDGKALKNNKVTVSGDGWAKGEGATYKVTGSQTKVGKSNNKFSYTLKSGTDAKNYNIVTKTGTLTVTEPVERGTFIHIKSITQKNNKLQINWTKVGQADGYDVYVQYCTKNFADPVKTIKKNATTQLTIAKLNGKKINLTKEFKTYVVAYKMVNGKKTVLAKTVTSHVVGVKNAKYTNQKALKLTKSAFDIKAGKTAKIKVSATLVDSKKKIIPKDHGAAFKFRSSNTRVATVDKDGKITAKTTGKCYIFVYGISGLMKKVTVTVK